MNQAFWNDPAVRRRGINLGVYRGVPFYTCPDPDCVWSAVDPTLKNPAVHFLAARSKYSPAGAEKIPIAPDALAVAKNLLRPQATRIIAQLQQNGGWERFPEAENYPLGSPETLTNYIEKMVQDRNLVAMEELFTAAGLGNYTVTLNTYDPDETQHDCIFFFADGRSVTAEQRKEFQYNALEIENWLEGNGYATVTPLGIAHGFCDDDSPSIKRPGDATTHIKATIKQALRPTAPARYKILVPFAREATVQEQGTYFRDVVFSWSKRILLQTDSIDVIEQIKASYPKEKVRVFSRKTDLPAQER